MSRENIYIIGAGGAGKDIAASLLAQGKYVNFVDDKIKNCVLDLPVVGTLDWFNTAIPGPVLIGVGSATLRKKIWERMINDRFYTHISHHSLIMNPDSFEIGVGSIIMPMVRITSEAKIGKNSLVHYGSHLSHDTRIGDHCVLMPNVTITSGVTIEDEVFVGSNVVISENVTIPKGSIIESNTLIKKT